MACLSPCLPHYWFVLPAFDASVAVVGSSLVLLVALSSPSCCCALVLSGRCLAFCARLPRFSSCCSPPRSLTPAICFPPLALVHFCPPACLVFRPDVLSPPSSTARAACAGGRRPPLLVCACAMRVHACMHACARATHALPARPHVLAHEIVSSVLHELRLGMHHTSRMPHGHELLLCVG